MSSESAQPYRVRFRAAAVGTNRGPPETAAPSSGSDFQAAPVGDHARGAADAAAEPQKPPELQHPPGLRGRDIGLWYARRETQRTLDRDRAARPIVRLLARFPTGYEIAVN